MTTYYTIYKTTNLVNSKIYIGSHKTKDLDDSYMGSGKYLNYAINKYGLENFTKEILHVFDNASDMYAKEADIVNKDFLAEENTYNLRIGGMGGFDYINSTGKNLYGMNGKTPNVKKDLAKGRASQQRLKEANPEYAAAIYKKISNTTKGRTGKFLGKSHTECAKEKISAANKGKCVGEKNSQHGTRWIYSLNEKKSIKININQPIPNGWLLGRKIKF